MNELMFNIGAVAACEDAAYLEHHLDPGLPVNTTITGYLEGHHTLYRIDLRWFAAADALVHCTDSSHLCWLLETR